jgi:CBS domain-containing protein
MQSAAILRRLTVSDAMHEGIVTCSPSAGLGEVAAAMAEHEIHCVVAIDEGPPGADDDRLWGVISDLDLMRGLGSPFELDAGNVAELTPAAATPEDTLDQAANTMASRRTAHLVVVDDGRPVGILSTLDIARAVAGADGDFSASGTARWRPPTRPILRSRPRP